MTNAQQIPIPYIGIDGGTQGPPKDKLLVTGSPMITTYSMWSLFRNCRKAVDWRYIQHLVGLERDGNLHFGSLVHQCLELWHQCRDLGRVLASHRHSLP